MPQAGETRCGIEYQLDCICIISQERSGHGVNPVKDMIGKLQQRFGCGAGDYVARRSHKRRRRYCFRDAGRPAGPVMLLAAGVCGLVFICSAGKLLSYGASYFASRSASEAMRSAYMTAVPAVSASLQPSAAPTAAPSAPPAVQATAGQASAATQTPWLEPAAYPYNPYMIINERFQALRRQNKDVVGWLRIDDLLDEAVVQRDNSYYLDRDYRGYHNVNGSIFLEQTCRLSTRPYTYLLYGHNMKSGLMFGCLRNYEDVTFCRNNPFITFDTLYEDGRYVVFAVATVSLDENNWRYVDFAGLSSSVVAQRQEALRALQRQSIYRGTIEVHPQDQLLLLITCVEDDSQRRVIAARRIREGEDEEVLREKVRRFIRR